MYAFMDWVMDYFLLPLMMLLLVVLLVVVGWTGWKAATAEPEPRIALEKSEWDCVKTESRTYLQPMLVGKIIVNQPVTNTVCVEYVRK